MPSYRKYCSDRSENVFFVVDDDNFISSLALTAVSSYGQVYEYKEASNLLENYKDLKPNIVFLDIHLGSKNGIELLQQILQEDPDAYVYMLSSDSTKDNVIKCRKLGAKGFIVKPFARKHFTDAIDRCETITPVSARNK